MLMFMTMYLWKKTKNSYDNQQKTYRSYMYVFVSHFIRLWLVDIWQIYKRVLLNKRGFLNKRALLNNVSLHE